MKRCGIRPALPPNPAPHLLTWLIEIGLTEAAGMGVVPISWREIDAWANRTRIDLPPWEARLIRQLSSAYVAESKAAESESRPPPWQTAAPATQRDIETEEALLRTVLG